MLLKRSILLFQAVADFKGTDCKHKTTVQQLARLALFLGADLDFGAQVTITDSFE